MALAEAEVMSRELQTATPIKKQSFLKALAELGTVTAACKACGIRRDSVYDWRLDDPAFGKGWEDAFATYYDGLEAVAFERAKEKSDLLMIFTLKAGKPEKYHDRIDVKHGGNVTSTVLLAAMTAEEREARIQALLAERAQLALGTSRSSNDDSAQDTSGD